MSDMEERAKARRGGMEVRVFRSMAEHDAADAAYWAKRRD